MPGLIPSKSQREFPLKRIGKGPPWFALVLVVLFCAGEVWGRVDVQATVDRNRMSADDTVILTIKVESEETVNVTEPRFDNFVGFDLLKKWRSRGSQSSFSNTPQGTAFKTLQTLKFNFQLVPQKIGKIVIHPVTVIVNGKIYKTAPITLKVTKGATGRTRQQSKRQQRTLPPSGPDPFSDIDDIFSQLLQRHGFGPPGSVPFGGNPNPQGPVDSFFIRVMINKTKIYVGEQLNTSWFLYTRGNIRNLDTLKYPSLSGFWKEDIAISTRLKFRKEIINGIPFRKALLASFALFPIKEGKAIVDPYEAKITFFGGGGRKNQVRKSQSVEIEVLPLPTENRPDSFLGGVGDYRVRAWVEGRKFVAHQPFSFKIKFEGRGNGKLIETPELKLPPVFRGPHSRSRALCWPPHIPRGQG